MNHKLPVSSYFDNEAKNWDDDPKHMDRALQTYSEINNNIKIENTFKCFEFGCGTALLSIMFYNDVSEISVYDNSKGMIAEVVNKITLHNLNRMKIIDEDDFQHGQKIENKFDLIYTIMTLHHLPKIEDYINKFSKMLKNNGYLCIGDLLREDGTFHQEHKDFVGYNGFEPNDIVKIGNEVNLDKHYLNNYYGTKKNGINYQMFMLILKKRI
jgi:ubiquinone/menaquinone biosynthesis C-methylase UbiE